MLHSTASIFTDLGGRFVISPENFIEKLAHIRAFVFDWDGVFNDGQKSESGSSNFNELDSMGTNLLRFGWWLPQKQMPYTAIISGERNHISFQLVQREHHHACYFRIKHKIEALEHFMQMHHLKYNQIAFFFDDALDLSIAKICGLRIMIKHSGNPLFQKYVIEHNLADYITAQEGGNFAIRESSELLLGMANIHDQVINERIKFYPYYNDYLAQRQQIESVFFTVENGNIIPQRV